MDETIDHFAHYPGISCTGSHNTLGCQPYYHVTADPRRGCPHSLCHRPHGRTLSALHTTRSRYSCRLSHRTDTPWLSLLSDYQHDDYSAFWTRTECKRIADSDQQRWEFSFDRHPAAHRSDGQPDPGGRTAAWFAIDQHSRQRCRGSPANHPGYCQWNPQHPAHSSDQYIPAAGWFAGE